MKADWARIAQGVKELGLDVTTGVSLRQMSRWQIGGLAEVVVKPRSASEVADVVRFCNQYDVPKLVVGDTSNLLFDDAGLQAVLIRIGKAMSDVSCSGTTIRVQAGRWVPSLARFSASRGLTGLEHTAGIPGTIGGLVCMNGGSQRKGIGEALVSVTAVMPDGTTKIFSKEECDFAYRTSVFQSNAAIITDVELELEPGEVQNIRREMLSILKSRREKFPLKLPNCGSVFASNPAMYDKVGAPGFAIEKVGLKGHEIGGAKISDLHANFFVNQGGARSKEMLELIHFARSEVYKKTGFVMDSEVRFVRQDGTLLSAGTK